MDERKLKLYCQFCLQEQHADRPKIPISRALKRSFEILTQKKLNTIKYSEFICCKPCLSDMEFAVSYRETLLRNQETLHEFYNKSMIVDEELDDMLEEHLVEESYEIKQEDEVNIQEFVDADAMIECNNCHQEINATFLDHHVCPPAKLEEEMSSSELDGLDDSNNLKKKYPKKKLRDPITCPKCDRQFFYKAYFQFHYKDVHRQGREEICQFCGKVFKNSRRLNSHILIHQTENEKKYKCEHCSKQFNFSGDLTRHIRVHENSRPYQCHLCPKSFVQSYALKLHINVHNKIRYTCDFCASEFSGKPTLKKHMIKCSNGIAVNRSTPRESSNLEKEKYKCFSEGCDRQFSSRKYLGIHLDKSHGQKFESFETTCLECQLVFDTVGDYSVHVKTHSCNFICELCKLRYKTDAKLQVHMTKAHKIGEDRPFVCPEKDCGARFKRAEHLKGHQLYKHSDERKFECSFCNLKFRQRGEFNVHMRVHSDTKPFSCWQCDHVCKTSSNLRQHMSLVHNEERIYFCKVCQQTFKYNTDLTQHKKEHSTTVYEVLEINE